MPINEVRQTPLGIAKRDVKIAQHNVQETKASATTAKNELDAYKLLAVPVRGPQLNTHKIQQDKLEWKSTIAEIKSGLSNVEEILAEMKVLFLELDRVIDNNESSLLQQVQDCLTTATNAQAVVSDQIDDLSDLIQQLHDDEDLDLQNNPAALNLLNQITGLRDRLVVSFNALPVAPAPAPAPAKMQLIQAPLEQYSFDDLQSLSIFTDLYKDQISGFVTDFLSKSNSEIESLCDPQDVQQIKSDFLSGINDILDEILLSIEEKIEEWQNQTNDQLEDFDQLSDDEKNSLIHDIGILINTTLIDNINEISINLFKNMYDYKNKFYQDNSD